MTTPPRTGSFLEMLAEHQAVVAASASLAPEVEAVADLCAEALRSGGRLLWCGNGGSAADAQHLAAEFVVRFERDRDALAALALTTDTSVLTAAGNDLGFERVFARQVEAFGRAGDVLFCLSTSGTSANVVAAATAARELGLAVIGLTGVGGGRLRELCTRCLQVPSRRTARIQELHMLIGHTLCGLVDERLSNPGR